MTTTHNLIGLLGDAVKHGYPLKTNPAYQELWVELREWPDRLVPGTPYLIHFDDADRRPEIWTDRAAAHHRYREISASWNAHLFVKVDSNVSRVLEDMPNHAPAREREAMLAAVEFTRALFEKERADESKDTKRILAAKRRLFNARVIARELLDEGIT